MLAEANILPNYDRLTTVACVVLFHSIMQCGMLLGTNLNLQYLYVLHVVIRH